MFCPFLPILSFLNFFAFFLFLFHLVAHLLDLPGKILAAHFSALVPTILSGNIGGAKTEHQGSRPGHQCETNYFKRLLFNLPFHCLTNGTVSDSGADSQTSKTPLSNVPSAAAGSNITQSRSRRSRRRLALQLRM